MAGQQFYDVLAMGTSITGKKGPTNTVRITADAAGALWASVKGGAFVPLATAINAHPVGFNFADETLALAQLLMPQCGFDRVIGTDFTPTWEASFSAANTPTIDQYWTGGVMQFGGAAGGVGTNQLALNPVTPGAATYNNVLGNIRRTRAVPWFARARVFIGSTAPSPAIFTVGKEVVLLSLDASYVGGAGITHNIQLVGMGSVHPTQVQVRLQGSTDFPGPTNVSTGPDGNFGVYNSLFPANQFVNIALYFDSTKLYWAFSDYYGNSNNVLDAAKGQLQAMPYDAGAVTVNASPTGGQDTTIGSAFKLDALAMAYCSETGNR